MRLDMKCHIQRNKAQCTVCANIHEEEEMKKTMKEAGEGASAKDLSRKMS